MNSYDEVPYNSYPYQLTHPDHLAMIGVLLGLEPPQRPYRLLELGCASGGNIIPQAAARPDCQFVGVDYSSRQIADGQATIDHLQLSNIELRAESILDLDATLGQFDYIVCHGVYSWVSSEVQAKILTLCQRLLRPQGLAYISYNTQPGWRQYGALRDMMRYHVGRQPNSSPAERVHQARGLLDFLVNANQSSNSSYARLLREQQELLSKHSDAYIFHEHLEQHNEPLWFLDFCQRLEHHGLRYIGEAEFSSMVASLSLSPELQQQLDQLAPNLIEKEQYTDFVRNRSFRQTLIGHAGLAPNYAVRGERLRGLWAATPGKIQANQHPGQEASWRLEVSDNLSLSTPLRSTQIALELLSQAWPERIAIADLAKQVAAQIDTPGVTPLQQQTGLEVALLTAFSSSGGRLLELSVGPLDQPTEDESRGSERRGMQTSPLTRWQAKASPGVVNRRHDLVPVMPIDRRLLPLLDGTRDVEQLVQVLQEQHAIGDLVITDEQDVPIAESSRIQEILLVLVPQRLAHFRRQSLLGPAGEPVCA